MKQWLLTWVRKFNYDQAVLTSAALTKSSQELEQDIEKTNRDITDRELFEQHGHLLKVKYDAPLHRHLKKMRRQLDQYEAQQRLLENHTRLVEKFERELKVATSAIDMDGVSSEDDLIEKVGQVITSYEKSLGQYQVEAREYERATKEIKRLTSNYEQYLKSSRGLSEPLVVLNGYDND